MIKANIKDIMNVFEKKIEEKFEKSLSNLKEILYKIFSLLYEIIDILKDLLKLYDWNEKSYMIINNCIYIAVSIFELSPKYYKLDELNNFINIENNLIKDLKFNIHPLNHLETNNNYFKIKRNVNIIENNMKQINDYFIELKKQIKDNETILTYINSIFVKFSKIIRFFIKEDFNLENNINLYEYFQLFNENILPIKQEINVFKSKTNVIKMIFLLKDNFLSKIQMKLKIKEIIKYFDVIILMNLEDEIEIEQKDIEKYIEILKLMKTTNFIEKYLLKIEENTLINAINFIIKINNKISDILKLQNDNLNEKTFLNFYSIYKQTNKEIKSLQNDKKYNMEFQEYKEENHNFYILIKYLEKIIDYQKKIINYNNLNNLKKYLREQFQIIFYNEFQERLILLI